MRRNCLTFLAIVAAGLVLGGTAFAQDDAKPPAKQPLVAPHNFYKQFLTPKIDSRLNGEIEAATEFTNPDANPWTRDVHTVNRIEKGALYAAKTAFKQYAIDSLKLNTWSVALPSAHTGVLSTSGDDGGMRLRFGISHLTPRADVMIPSAHGKVVFSADVRGRVATSFESHASTFSFGVSYDPVDNSAACSLVRRF
jgi:hypothetical protein